MASTNTRSVFLTPLKRRHKAPEFNVKTRNITFGVELSAERSKKIQRLVNNLSQYGKLCRKDNPDIDLFFVHFGDGHEDTLFF